MSKCDDDDDDHNNNNKISEFLLGASNQLFLPSIHVNVSKIVETTFKKLYFDSMQEEIVLRLDATICNKLNKLTSRVWKMIKMQQDCKTLVF